MVDKLHIITVGWNNWNDSKECLDSIISCTKDYHLIFVNNGSTDETTQEFQKHFLGKVDYVQSDKNLGFSGGFNLGLNRSHLISDDPDQLICIINNDMVVRPGWLDTYVEAYKNCEES